MPHLSDPSGSDAEEPAVERFRPTSGRVVGSLGLAVATVAVVLAGLELPARSAWMVLTGAVFVGLACWAALLRPAVHVAGSTLVMRNLLETVSIPLAAIEQVAVRQVLVVRAGDRRYVSPAIGRSWRSTAKSTIGLDRDEETPTVPGLMDYPDFVEDRLYRLCEEDRRRRGIELLGPQQQALASEIRRQPSLAVLVSLGISLAAFAAAILL